MERSQIKEETAEKEPEKKEVKKFFSFQDTVKKDYARWVQFRIDKARGK